MRRGGTLLSCRSDDLTSVEAAIWSFRLSVPLKKSRGVARVEAEEDWGH